ncbi:MAG: hypothetical protein P4L61_02185 [Candidatus Pacebacteria bacterium]|nr:hypothetical protein [Candidatus Paceibacterota bacterium]
MKKPAAIISEISPVNVGLDLLAGLERDDLDGLPRGACPTPSNRAIRATISSSVPSIVTVPPLAVATVALGIEHLPLWRLMARRLLSNDGIIPTIKTEPFVRKT